ncbi:MAG: hypothetical protein IKE53_09360 [Clostridiales bacterium]|nr:hypothetical protein [Clostridiales bacterium]
MELNKCPNCSGKMEPSANRTKMICPYCGSEFAMDDATKEAIGKEPVNKDWFIYEWDYGKLSEDPVTKTAVSAFVRTLNDYDSSSEVEKYIRDYLMHYDEISAPGLREEKMKGIMSRISPMLEPGERVVLYNDDGLFVHGKTGVVITDRRTLIIERKKIKEISHVSVPYLLFESGMGLSGIKLGERYSNSIGIFNSHFDLQGTAAALICFYSFEINSSRPKIRLMS